MSRHDGLHALDRRPGLCFPADAAAIPPGEPAGDGGAGARGDSTESSVSGDPVVRVTVEATTPDAGALAELDAYLARFGVGRCDGEHCEASPDFWIIGTVNRTSAADCRSAR